MIESAELASQFEKGEEVSISFQYVSREIDIALNSLLAKALARIDLLFLYETLEAILREVVQNAVKANMKRVWFKSHGLDIDSDEDYAEGMHPLSVILIAVDIEAVTLEPNSLHVRLDGVLNDLPENRLECFVEKEQINPRERFG